MSRCRWVAVEWRPWVISLTVSAAAAAPLYTRPLFKFASLFCFFFLCAQGGVPKQVLFRPGLQVPAVHF